MTEKLQAEKSQAYIVAENMQEYIYSNEAFVLNSNLDFRLLFADRVSNDKSAARIGIILSHEHAKRLLEAIKTSLELAGPSGKPVPPDSAV